LDYWYCRLVFIGNYFMLKKEKLSSQDKRPINLINSKSLQKAKQASGPLILRIYHLFATSVVRVTSTSSLPSEPLLFSS
jgi:hypothetical protein